LLRYCCIFFAQIKFEEINVAIRTLARTYKWTPFEIGKLYIDDIDFEGLFYWFEDAKQYIDEIKTAAGGK
jgi:hypothetical protein